MTSRNWKLSAMVAAGLAAVAGGPARSAVAGTLESIFASSFETGNCSGWSDKVPAECDDGVMNGDESDIDCGGLTCDVCQPGQGCNQASDCGDLPGWTQAYPVCSGGTCDMGCSGENYDVDGSNVNGCEVLDSPLGNHTQATASNLGDVSCFDGGGITVTFSGSIPSDQREHAVPPVGGFDVVSGSAPDYARVHATGGVCADDVVMTLIVGGSLPNCYQLLVNTDQGLYSCNTVAGSCNIICNTGCYTDGTDVFITVKKTCSAATEDNASYDLTGHL